MKKYLNLLIAMIAPLGLVSPIYAAETECSNFLPQVTLQLTAQEWVTTAQAKVTIALDALLNKQQLTTAQEDFQAALKKIAPGGVWHITEYSRSASKANLEQIHAVAEARLSDKEIAGLRERAHALNSEGQTYTVQDIVYNLSTEEISASQARLRAQIYAQAKSELDRLNAVYSKPGYNLYSINFTNTSNFQPGPLMGKVNTMVSMSRETPAPTLSQEISQDALVILATPPRPCSAKAGG